MATKPIHIMIIGAHPADVFDQAGGTLAHHVERGDKVTAVVVTTGVRSHHFKLLDKKRQAQEKINIEPGIQQAVEEKTVETRNACKILGFDDVRTLGFEDDDILLTREMVESIATVIREVCPDVLITHHPYEGGGFKMHATVGQATIYAYQQAMTSRGTQRFHAVASIFFMNPMAYMGHNSLGYASTSQVDIYVDITDVVEKKVKAMDYISSQHYDGAYARKAVENEDGRYGQMCGVAYAEAFQRFMPWVCYTLPVSDAELHRVQSYVEGSMGRRGEIIAARMPLPPGQSFTSDFRIRKELYEG